ncbi:hypothetical protein DMENIID0001_169590 [Sergentomyia squamirostris]
MTQLLNQENGNLETETANSLPRKELIKAEVLDVEDTELIYSSHLVYPANLPQAADNSGDSSLSNRSAEIVPEILNPADGERKKPKRRQRKTLRNDRFSGKIKPENTSKVSEDKAENSSRKKKKTGELPFGPPPEDFVLPPYHYRRSFDKNSLWSALMSVKNCMSTQKACRIYKLNNHTLLVYMKKFGIKSKFKRAGW